MCALMSVRESSFNAYLNSSRQPNYQRMRLLEKRLGLEQETIAHLT
jgi:hypothetical protein